MLEVILNYISGAVISNYNGETCPYIHCRSIKVLFARMSSKETPRKVYSTAEFRMATTRTAASLARTALSFDSSVEVSMGLIL